MYQNDMIIIFLDINGKAIYHMGASYIVAYLNDMGYKAMMYLDDGALNCDSMVEAILNFDPLCIGFSVYDTNFYLANSIAEKIREKSTKKRYLLAGGPAATFSSQKLLTFSPYFDLCIRNEGEETSYELIKQIKNGESYDHLPGITYRSAAGTVVQNPDRKLPRSLDEFPSPFLSGIIDIKDNREKNGWIAVFTSRGCVFGCRYCNYAAVARHSIRTHSIDRVIDEVKYITEHYEGDPAELNLEFMDDIFTINRKRTIELCERLQAEVPTLVFGIQTRIDFMDEELLDHLYSAGCRRVSYGLESGVPKILHAMGKVNTVNDPTYKKEIQFHKQMKYIVEQSKKRGFDVSVSINLGWLSETREEGMQTLEFVDQLDVDRYSHCYTVYYAGTEAYSMAAAQIGEKIQAFEAAGQPVFNINYNSFPELYSYDVYELDHLKNDMFAYSIQRRKQILQSIMGQGFKGGVIPEILIITSDNIGYEWIRDRMPMGTCAVFKRDQEALPEWYFSITPFAYEHYDSNWGQLFGNAKIIREADNVRGKDTLQFRAGGFKVIRIEDLADAVGFVSQIEQANLTEVTDLFKIHNDTEMNDGYMIEDYCRWCGKCAATNLSRLIIKDDELYTCFAGKPVGRIDDKLDFVEMSRKVSQWSETEYEKRNCAACPINETCPKCLFVDHIGQENYCSLQQRIKKANSKFKTIYRLKNMEYFYEL